MKFSEHEQQTKTSSVPLVLAALFSPSKDSVFLRGCLFWVAIWVGLSGCVPLGQPVVSERSQQPPITGDTFLVRQGDTLYSIAWRAGKDYKTLAQINAISAPFTIYPGQRLRLVAPEKKAPAAKTKKVAKAVAVTKPKTATSASKPKAKAKPKVKATPKPTKPRPVKKTAVKKPPPKKSKVARQAGPLTWVRPIKQKPSVSFGNGNKGWDYRVQGKTRMRAASGGEVVYAGNGIAGYERLVIVKHSGNLLSAYSFNGRITVSEQQQVRTGQSLAELAPRNGNSQKVHFELRRDGKPINPSSLIKPP